MKPSCPPVLFCIFNRPDLTEKSFEQIRKARPSKLFVSADGPRVNREGEPDLCEAARSIVHKVDWPCETHTLLRSKNVGCQMAMSSGIDWFFEHVDAGIILEDDCVAHPAFFGFCQQLLERYKDDKRVMCITGNNFQRGAYRGDASYYFSMFPHCWGWASWKRAWNLYDPEMSSLSQIVQTGLLANLVGTGFEDWLSVFKQVEKGEVNSWAYRWLLSCWSQHGLTATPNKNLVTNIGFDERATHTKSTTESSIIQSFDIGKIINPTFLQRNCAADEFVLNEVFGRTQSTKKQRIFLKLKKAAKAILRKLSLTYTNPARYRS